MIKRTLYLIIIAFNFALFCDSCKEKSKIKIKKTYFPSGKIETYGHYLNDSTPIDTFYIFYKNGNIERKVVFDSTGKPEGIAQLYFENGRLKSKKNYVNGLVQGISSIYDSLGNLDTKAFWYNNKMVGDFYEFRNNILSQYRFSDFQKRLANIIDYDSTGRVEKEINLVPFIDSVKLTTNEKDVDTCSVLVVISNPVNKSNKIIVEYLNHSKNKIGIDSTQEGNERVFYKERIFKANELGYIEVIGKQYDSTTRKYFVYKNIHNIVK